MRGIIRKTGEKGTNMTEDRDKYRKQALYQVDNLAKPPGSLGTLEKQAKQVLLAWGQFHKNFGRSTSFFRLTTVSSIPVSSHN